MKDCDKNLATSELLRDNGIVFTPDIGAERRQARMEGRTRQGSLAERNRSHLILLAKVMKAWRLGQPMRPRDHAWLIPQPSAHWWTRLEN